MSSLWSSKCGPRGLIWEHPFPARISPDARGQGGQIKERTSSEHSSFRYALLIYCLSISRYGLGHTLRGGGTLVDLKFKWIWGALHFFSKLCDLGLNQ